MANLTFTDVLLIGAVGTIGFVLLCWGIAALMARKGWSLQVKGKPKAGSASGPAAKAAAAPPSAPAEVRPAARPARAGRKAP